MLQDTIPLSTLQRVANWISTNGLRMDISKTQLMVLSSRKKQWLADSVHVNMGEGELLRQDSVKYLGVNIDRSLSWESHIDRVRQKCFAGLASIRRAGYLPCHVRKLLYLFPHLDYCAVAWHSCGVAMSDRIERIQNYAIRVILRQPPRTISAVRQALGWTTLRRRRQNTMLRQVHRCLCVPPYLTSKFVINSTLGYTVT